MTRVIPFAVLAAVLLSGCSNFTEYSGTPSAGLLFVDPDNLELLGAIDGIEGGRALCAGGGTSFFVTATSGEFHICDSGTMSIDTSFVIGPGASAGYGSMAWIPGKNTVYVIGALGNILEVQPSTGLVIDEITAGSSPTCMVPSRNVDFVYVTDPLNNKVHAIRTSTNAVLKTWLLQGTPTVMCTSAFGSDTLLISTNDSKNVAYIQPADFGSLARKVNLPPASDLNASDSLELLFAAHPGYGYSSGSVSVIDSLFPFSIRNTISVPGNPTYLEVNDNQMNLFILSSTESGDCTLYCYGLSQSILLDSIDLPGTPVDMVMAGNRLVILTY